MIRYPRVSRLWIAALRASVAAKKRQVLAPLPLPRQRRSIAQLLVASRAVR